LRLHILSELVIFRVFLGRAPLGNTRRKRGGFEFRDRLDLTEV